MTTPAPGTPRHSTALLTDHYELTMLEAALHAIRHDAPDTLVCLGDVATAPGSTGLAHMAMAAAVAAWRL